MNMPNKPRLKALTPKREEVLCHCWVDAELKREIKNSAPKGLSLKKAVQRGLLHVLSEINPKTAKRIIEALK